MPRAYYRPFTAYEEAVGFHSAKRNAYFFCAFLFGGLLFKIALAYRFSPVSNREMVEAEASRNPRYAASLERRAALAESSMTREQMKEATQRHRQELLRENQERERRQRARALHRDPPPA